MDYSKDIHKLDIEIIELRALLEKTRASEEQNNSLTNLFKASRSIEKKLRSKEIKRRALNRYTKFRIAKRESMVAERALRQLEYEDACKELLDAKNKLVEAVANKQPYLDIQAEVRSANTRMHNKKRAFYNWLAKMELQIEGRK